MILMLKIVLIFIVFVIAEDKNQQLRSIMTVICIASLFVTVAAFIWI